MTSSFLNSKEFSKKRLLSSIIVVFLFVSIFFSSFTKGEGISNPVFSPSQECWTCHKNIYKDWSNSMHAKAVEDPVFKSDYLHALDEQGEKVRGYCLNCHSPVTRYTGDVYLKNQISVEGINCDFCHSVQSIDLENSKNPFMVNPGSTEYGPYQNASSPAHQTEYSELHTQSEFCAGCHQLKNGNEVLVLGTYSEWKQSPYPDQGTECQNCHMPKVPGMPIVDPKVKKSQLDMTSHLFLGGHSEINLQHAATLRTELKVERGKALVTVFVTNAESGHKLPTGIPARKIVLQVRLLNKKGELISQQEKVYQKILLGQNDEVLTESYKMILDGASISSDNRIAPKETRQERFEFNLAPGTKPFSVEAALRYQYPVPVLTTGLMEVEMAKQVVSLPQKGVFFTGFLGWLKVFVILLILVLILWIGFRSVRRLFG
ncbi:MAG TPA: multiheme c-type cytochrome [Terriglobales bacterium]|nr:multiheme c-type cytochrome [Terriglobales bacterium]